VYDHWWQAHQVFAIGHHDVLTTYPIRAAPAAIREPCCHRAISFQSTRFVVTGPGDCVTGDYRADMCLPASIIAATVTFPYNHRYWSICGGRMMVRICVCVAVIVVIGAACCTGDSAGDAAGDTWTDPASGLTWQVMVTGGPMSGNAAMAHCSKLKLGGGGWYLPTIEELRTLIRGCSATQVAGSCTIQEGSCLAMSCWDDVCDGCSAQDGPAGGCYLPSEMEGPCTTYWSSSFVEKSPIQDVVWTLDFNDGGVSAGSLDYNDVTYGPQARCVR
jgi:hypothetical protein